MSINFIYGIITGALIPIIGIIISFLIEVYRKKITPSLKRLETLPDIYRSIWKSLNRLEKASDRLWRNVNEPNLDDFAEKLQEVEIIIKDNEFLIDKSLYNRFFDLTENYIKYQRVKGSLFEYYEKRRKGIPIDIIEIRSSINSNKNTLKEIKKIKKDISDSIRRQLGTLR